MEATQKSPEKGKSKMSDEKPIVDLKDITNEQIVLFLERVAQSHDCPVCKNKTWSVLNDKKHILGMIALPKDGSMSFPPGTLPVAAVQCNNCGYLRFHGLGLIASKL